MNTEAGTSKLFPEFSLPPGVPEDFKGIKDFFADTSNKAVSAIAETAKRSKDSLNETAEKAVSTVQETTNNALGTAAERADKGKDILTEVTRQAVNKVSAVTEQAIGSVTQTADQATGTLSETASKAISTVGETTDKTLGRVTQTAEKAKDTLTEVTGQAVTEITSVTNRAIGSVTETTEQAKASINEMVQGTENLTGGIADALQTRLSNTIHNWIAEHPVISWAVSHPLLTLGIVLLFIFVLRVLFKLLAQLVEKACLFVLKSPLILGTFLLSSSRRLLGSKRANESGQASSDSRESLSVTSTDQQVKLAQLLERLEEINQEQSQLLQKVATLLDSTKG